MRGQGSAAGTQRLSSLLRTGLLGEVYEASEAAGLRPRLDFSCSPIKFERKVHCSGAFK